MQHGRKLARFHGKTDKTGGAVGRPSCQSSLLSDPNAKFSKEGRHVGLDFYDLLIEANEAAAEATKLSELSV